MLLLLQLRVFSFGLLVDGDIGISVFPEGEEVFVRGQGDQVVDYGSYPVADLMPPANPSKSLSAAKYAPNCTVQMTTSEVEADFDNVIINRPSINNNVEFAASTVQDESRHALWFVDGGRTEILSGSEMLKQRHVRFANALAIGDTLAVG